MSGFTGNEPDESFEPNGVDVDVSPPNEAVSVYVFDGSVGVMSQVATPWAFVFCWHDSRGLPLSVKVTGSPAIGRPVLGLVSVAWTGVAVSYVKPVPPPTIDGG